MKTSNKETTFHLNIDDTDNTPNTDTYNEPGHTQMAIRFSVKDAANADVIRLAKVSVSRFIRLCIEELYENTELHKEYNITTSKDYPKYRRDIRNITTTLLLNDAHLYMKNWLNKNNISLPMYVRDTLQTAADMIKEKIKKDKEKAANEKLFNK